MKASKLRSPLSTASLKKILKLSNPSISNKVGLPPGSIIYTGKPKEQDTEISLLHYDEAHAELTRSSDLTSMLDSMKPKEVNWLNFDSLHNVDLIIQVGERFNIHNLTLEDIVNVNHQPKMEEYENYLFLAMKTIKPEQGNGTFTVEYMSFVLTENTLLSFQEYKGDPFDLHRERITTGKGKARGRGPDYLLFLLIDAIVDQYLLSIESINKHISEIELEILERPDETIVNKIIEQKKIVSTIRQIIFPVREMLKEITQNETEFIDEAYSNYYNDVFDHVKHMIELLDNQRESLTSLMEFHIAQISINMNKVMQTLTIIATIFIPLTFLAGIYGMNFETMPELGWKWSYPLLLFVMLVLGVSMYIYMRRRRWF